MKNVINYGEIEGDIPDSMATRAWSIYKAKLTNDIIYIIEEAKILSGYSQNNALIYIKYVE